MTGSGGAAERGRAAVARALRWLGGAAAVSYLALYVVLAFLRLGYPFELEWMEGGSLEHVARLLRGEPLYVAPGLEFIPFQYPPLYYAVAAAVAKLTGTAFFALRAVSFASSAACFLAIYALVWHEAQDRLAALVAAGLFAATFRAGGAWLDLGRVDALFLALFLAGLLAMRLRPTVGGYALAGALFALSSLTKQTALAMCLPLLVLAAVTAPRRAAALASSLLAVAGGATGALVLSSHGWYWFYVWRFPFLHPWAHPVFVTFWTEDLLRPLPIAATAAAVTLAGLLGGRERSLFWLMAAIGMVGGAYRSRLQTGGYDNVLLPAYAVVCLLSGLGLAAARRMAAGASAGPRHLAEAAIWSACLVQMIVPFYDPRAALPRPGDRRAGEDLVRFLGGVEGEVFVPCHGYLAARAGKRSYAHMMAVFDILKLGLPEAGPLAEQHREAIRQQRFGAIVVDDPEHDLFMPEIESAYVRTRELFRDPEAFFPVTGVRTRPQYVYLPRRAVGSAGVSGR